MNEQQTAAETVALHDELLEQCRIVGMGAEREAALQGEIERLNKALRQALAAAWVGLTDKERNQLWRDVVKWGDTSHDDVDLMEAIEQALKEKNT